MRCLFRRFNLMALVLVGLAGLGCSGHEEGGVTLHVVLPTGPTSRDPLETFDESSYLVFSNVVQTITGDPLGVGPASGVVERWTNPDSSTWVLHLRKGLRFHNGAPVTAHDVAACLLRIKSEGSSPLNAFLENVVDVTVESDEQLTVFASGTVNIVSQLAFIPVIPGGAPVPPDGVPVGSGPYRVVTWGKNRIILERVGQAPAPKQSAERAEFLVITDGEQQVEAARSLRPLMMMAPRKAVLKKAEELHLRRVELNNLASLYLVCNLRPNRPLASLEARRALAAISREVLSFPAGMRWLPADDIIPRSVFGRVAGRFDPKPEWNVPAAVPKNTIEFVAIDTLEPVGKVMAAGLRDAGWRVNLLSVRPGEALKALEAGRFDLAVMGYSCTSGSALELFQFAFSSRGETKNGSNFSGYRDAQLDAILEEATTSLDPAVQHDLVVRAGNIVVEDLPWIPLYDITRTYLLSPSVSVSRDAARGVRLREVRIGP